MRGTVTLEFGRPVRPRAADDAGGRGSRGKSGRRRRGGCPASRAVEGGGQCAELAGYRDDLLPPSRSRWRPGARVREQPVAGVSRSALRRPPACGAVRRPSVLAAGDPTAAPALRVEIEEFAQYFDSASTSHGVVQMRATLFDGPKLLAQTTLRAQAPAATADAAGGAKALAAACDAVQTQLIQWLAGRVPAPSATTRAPAESHATPASMAQPATSGAAAPAR